MKLFILFFAAALGSQLAQADNIPVRWEHGTELMLFGSADLAAANRYLAPLGLEAIADHDAATVALAPGQFQQSRFGSFSSILAAIMARPKGSTDPESWYFFGIANSSLELNNVEDQALGVRVSLGKTFLNLGQNSGRAMTEVNGQKVLMLSMGQAALEQAPAAYHFTVYSQIGSKMSTVQYHHDCTGTAYNRDFNPETDTYASNPNSLIGHVLNLIQFKPASWSLYFTDEGQYVVN